MNRTIKTERFEHITSLIDCDGEPIKFRSTTTTRVDDDLAGGVIMPEEMVVAFNGQILKFTTDHGGDPICAAREYAMFIIAVCDNSTI